MSGPSPDRPRPLLVGVTGGIGAGKSAALDAFVRAGAVAFSSDDVVHALYGRDDVRDSLRERWGDAVFAADGSVDRSAVADIVFADADELAWLESVLHPLVGREWLAFVQRVRESDDAPQFVVAEVPLLFESNIADRYDATVLITAPLDLRLQRVGERAHGNTHLTERARKQMPEEQKAELADYVYVNDGDVAMLAAFVESVMHDMLQRQSGNAK